LLTGKLKVREDEQGTAGPQAEVRVALTNQGHQTPDEVPEEEGRHRESDADGEPPAKKKLKRRMPRKKVVCGEKETWEAARRDAWLSELLTDSSGDESENKCTRFEESRRWIAEMGELSVEAGPTLPGDTSHEDFVKGALATLDMLDERAGRMGERLEEIERRVMRMGEGRRESGSSCKKEGQTCGESGQCRPHHPAAPAAGSGLYQDSRGQV
jgi:hypothetical protein